MSSFFKRLSRSRGNSQSYVDDDFPQRPPSEGTAAAHGRPPSAYQSPAHLDQGTQDLLADSDGAMYSQPSPQGYSAGATRPLQPHGASSAAQQQQQPPPSAMRQPHNPSARADSQTRDSGYADVAPMSPGLPPGKGGDRDRDAHMSGMGSSANLGLGGPDLLAAAFHQAVKPYTDKIEVLEQQLADMQDYIAQTEQQRMEIFGWIDKRGLRPDVPPAIAKQMDETSDAASSLNAQLDRKITIVNFDLHRLQDDLNDSISSAHFASAMAKFLPDIQRLTALAHGAKFAYELLIKLVGNLNSHGGLEALGSGGDGDGGADGTSDEVEDDRRARAAFYARMDDELVAVVRRRAADPADAWGKPGLAGEVKRLERNAAYLRNLGIDSYFPRALDVMKREAAGGAPAGFHAAQASAAHGHGQVGAGSPPSYSH